MTPSPAEPPNLRKPTARVSRFDRQIRALCDTLFELCQSEEAWGMAAPQIDIPLRAAVVLYEGVRFDLVNLQVTGHNGHVEMDHEGCVSLRGQRFMVPRFTQVKVRAQSHTGKDYSFVTSDPVLARILQHEADHCDGRLIDVVGIPIIGGPQGQEGSSSGSSDRDPGEAAATA